MQGEVKKSWQRYQLRRGGASFNLHIRDRSFMNTSTTYVSPEERKNPRDYHKYNEDTVIEYDTVCPSNGQHKKSNGLPSERSNCVRFSEGEEKDNFMNSSQLTV